jgi:hypothetical protein
MTAQRIQIKAAMIAAESGQRLRRMYTLVKKIALSTALEALRGLLEWA